MEVHTMIKPEARKVDTDVSELIGRHIATHQPQTTDPRDDDFGTVSDVADLMDMAKPGLDGNEEAAINRLRLALEAEETHTPH
jgi:hypothetical protein